MHWYNPKTRSVENAAAPLTDEEALGMLRGHANSGAFMSEYDRLRWEEGMPPSRPCCSSGTTSGCATCLSGPPASPAYASEARSGGEGLGGMEGGDLIQGGGMVGEGTIRERHDRAWGRFVAAEREELERRKAGWLARALGGPLLGESAAEIERRAEEDRGLAERGMVELRRGCVVWHKSLDELTPEDRQARHEAHTALTEWFVGRQIRRGVGPR